MIFQYCQWIKWIWLVRSCLFEAPVYIFPALKLPPPFIIHADLGVVVWHEGIVDISSTTAIHLTGSKKNTNRPFKCKFV